MIEQYLVGAALDEKERPVNGVYRSIENPNLPLTDAAIWGEYGLAATSTSGISITAQSALTYAPVWQAVAMISGDVAKLPLCVYRKLPGNGREEHRTHAAFGLLKKQANERQHAIQFWRTLMTHLLLWNNAYALISRDAADMPIALTPLLPDRTHPKYIDGAGGINSRVMRPLVYVTEVEGDLYTLDTKQVLHLQGITIDGTNDCELVRKARDSWALGLAAQGLASRYFKHGGRVGGTLELPPTFGKRAADTMEEGFRKTYESGDAQFRTVILREGAKFHRAQFNAEEVQLSDSREQQTREVARWYNLPPHKLGLAINASYSSLEQENQAYLDSCLGSHLTTIKAECEMKLLTRVEHTRDEVFVEHNTMALLRADGKTRTEIYQRQIDAGILSPDEARAKENMNPRPDGEGGVYRYPGNMVLVGASQGADADRAAVVAAATAALVDSLSRSLAGPIDAAKRHAKRGLPHFANWCQSKLAEPEIVRGRIAPAARVVGSLYRVDPEQLTDRLVDRLFEVLTAEIARSIESNPVEALVAAMADIGVAINDQLDELIERSLGELLQ